MTPIIKYNPDSIRMLRLSHNLTPPDFARRIGVQRQHIRAWEAGTIPHTRGLIQIANAFGVKMDIFFIVDDYSENEDNHTERIAAG